MKRLNKKFVNSIDIKQSVIDCDEIEKWNNSYRSEYNKNNIKIISYLERKSSINRKYCLSNGLKYYNVENDTKNKIYNFLGNLDLDNFGFSELKENMVMNTGDDAESLFKYMIVISKKIDSTAVNNIPSNESLSEFIDVYRKLDKASVEITDFIESLGYLAYNTSSNSGEVNYTLAGQEAGLGWIGKSGLLISPNTGSTQRLNIILTNISNLEKNHEDHSWIEDYCEKCGICVKACPASAIYSENRIEDGFLKFIDYKKCIKYYSVNYACGICIKTCPFNKINYYTLKKGMKCRKM